MATTQSFNRREKAADLLNKIENFERREQLEEIMEKLNSPDMKEEKTETRGSRNVSAIPLDLVAELLMAFAGREQHRQVDGRRGRSSQIQDLLEMMLSGDQVDGRGGSSSQIRNMLEMMLGSDQSTSGRRDEQMRRVVLEVILMLLVRDRGSEGGRRAGMFSGKTHRDELEEMINEVMGSRRSRSSTRNVEEMMEELMGRRRVQGPDRFGGSRLLELLLDIIETTDNGSVNLEKVLLRTVLEYLVQEKTSTRFNVERMDNDRTENFDAMSMLVKRIMYHLINDVESARMELEILNHLMDGRNRNRNVRRDAGWGLMKMIREHMGGFDADTRRQMESNDIIRAILRLRYDDNLRDNDDMDTLIVHLLRNWCTDYLKEHKVRRGRRFSDLIDYVQELTMGSIQDHGRRRGNFEEAIRLQQFLERQGNRKHGDRVFGQIFDDDFHRRGDSQYSGTRQESLLHELFNREAGYGDHRRFNGGRWNGLGDRWM